MKILNLFFFGLFFLCVACEQHELPSVDIRRDGPIFWEEKKSCVVLYSDGNNEDELRGKIKFRGGISSKYFKHSFSLELDDKYSFAGLPEDDDWILNANYIDKTFMRHKISYDLFREMSDENLASRSSYMNVFVNGNYEGLYVLMEEINASMLGLDKRDSMAMLFKDPLIFRQDGSTHVQDTLNKYQQKYPKIYQDDKTNYLDSFRDFLFNADDRVFYKDIFSWVDINSLIDWHLILLFTNNGDGIVKNFYMYKINEETPFRFAIWDYDHSFGRDGDNEHNLMERELNCNKSILFERLSKYPDDEYLVKLRNRWFDLRERDIISYDNFVSLLNRNDRLIQGEIAKNFEKWPVESKWYYDNNNYREELALMREFVVLRIDQLDEYFTSVSNSF